MSSLHFMRSIDHTSTIQKYWFELWCCYFSYNKNKSWVLCFFLCFFVCFFLSLFSFILCIRLFIYLFYNIKSGDGGHRSHCPFHAKEMLYHLSYIPILLISFLTQTYYNIKMLFHSFFHSLQASK